MPKMFGSTPIGRVSRRAQKEYEPIEGYVRVEGRREDPGLRQRPPRRIYVCDGVQHRSVRSAARALGCSEEGFKRAVRNGKQQIFGRSFTVWEERKEKS